VGYSDATSLLLWLDARARLCGIHGPMLERADVPEAARERLLALLRGEPAGLEALAGTGLRQGRARGRLVGGNLRLVAASLGTPWEIDTRGAILFLEEIGEQPYSVDRSLVQLREAGKLAAAAGVAIGALIGCESERYPETSARAALCEILAGAVAGPIALDLPFGHIADHRALGFGVRAELDGASGTLELLEPVVDAGGSA
jgi:muramoyltetrapeptide carboxypeptidase